MSDFDIVVIVVCILCFYVLCYYFLTMYFLKDNSNEKGDKK